MTGAAVSVPADVVDGAAVKGLLSMSTDVVREREARDATSLVGKMRGSYWSGVENMDTGWAAVVAVDVEAPDGPAATCGALAIRDFIELRLERCDVVPEFGVTVLSCSWMSIMWSPSRMLRFSGVFPLKKSLTWLSLSDSSACMTVFSGRCAWGSEKS